MKNILAILLISLVFLSCETILEDVPTKSLPELKEKLVLTSFISPQDSVISVKVTVSSPLFGEYKSQYGGFSVLNGDTTLYFKSNNIPDAIVTLSTGNQSITISYDKKTQFYSVPTARFKIEAGKTYTLKAKSKNLEVEATTVVPLETIKIEKYSIDSTAQIGFRKDTIQGFEVKLEWADLVGKTNYYRLKGEWSYMKEFPLFKTVNNQQVIQYQARPQVDYFRWDKNDFSNLKSYIDDNNSDGKTIYSPTGIIYESRSYSSSNGSPTTPSRRAKGISTIRLELMNISKEYYDYATSLIKSNEANNNPFAEPVPVFSNVKNGLGCFAGYNKSELVLKVK
jgi:hypothetical protein